MGAYQSMSVLYATCLRSSDRFLACFVARQYMCELFTILPLRHFRMPFVFPALCGHSFRNCTASMCTAVSALVNFFAKCNSDREDVCTRLARTIRPQFHCINHSGEYREQRGLRKTQSLVYRRSKYTVYDLGMRARYAYMLIIYAISQVNGQMTVSYTHLTLPTKA